MAAAAALREGGDAAAGRNVAVAAVAFYCACSATMLISNKVAVVAFPFPNMLLCMQLAASAGVPWVLGKLGYLRVNSLERKKVRGFIKAVLVFFGTLFTSLMALRDLNVDTIIVVRSSLPLAVAMGDWLFMQRELPGLRTWFSLGMVLAGSVMYARAESKLRVARWLWAACYWAFMVADQLVLKHVVSRGPELTTWGRVYYQNTLSLVPAALFVASQGEWGAYHGQSRVSLLNPQVALPVLSSCVVGCGISFAGFLLREHVSALTFTVIGVACKLATVGLNLLMWSRHASPQGTLALVVCVAGASMYRQPRLRPGAWAERSQQALPK